MVEVSGTIVWQVTSNDMQAQRKYLRHNTDALTAMQQWYVQKLGL